MDCVNNGDKYRKYLFRFILFIPREGRIAPPHRVAPQVDAVGVVDEPIEDGVGIGRVADHVVIDAGCHVGGGDECSTAYTSNETWRSMAER